MKQMTLDDLRYLLVSVAGDSGVSTLEDDISDADFTDLGYDSLALMETAAAIRQGYGVTIPDAVLFELRTPRQMLDAVNGAVSELS